MKFRVGDKVKCIKQSEYPDFYCDLNKVYTISEIAGKGMSLKEHQNPYAQLMSRFVKANSQIIKEKLGVK